MPEQSSQSAAPSPASRAGAPRQIDKVIAVMSGKGGVGKSSVAALLASALTHMRDMVDRIKAGHPPATEHLQSPELVELARRLFKESSVREVPVVLNRVRDDEIESYLRRALADRGLAPIAVLPELPELMFAWLHGEPLPIGRAEQAAQGILRALEAAEMEQSVAGEKGALP
jgi:CO dehydrogenase nickel-insertion accessory protein CooC1